MKKLMVGMRSLEQSVVPLLVPPRQNVDEVDKGIWTRSLTLSVMNDYVIVPPRLYYLLKTNKLRILDHNGAMTT